MSVQFMQPTKTNTRALSLSAATLTAVSLSIVIALGLSWLWPHLRGPAALALWPLSGAVGCLATAVFHYSKHGESLWGLALFGQLLGVIATALFFLAAI